MSATPKIFISYAREDSAIAQRLYHDLRRAGAEAWLDTENLLPGQQWQPAIRQAITECQYFIALLSAQAVSKRGFLQSEMKQALELLNEFPENEIFVVPVRLDDCSPSHERLKSIHWVDLFPYYEKGLKKLESVVFRGIDSNKDQLPSILEIFGIEWVGGGAYARTPQGKLPLAEILTEPKPHQITTFLGRGCAVAFDLEVARGLSWATIEQILVFVHSYRPLSEYETIFTLPFEEAHVYYVEINDPEIAKCSRFLAKYSFKEDQRECLGVIRLRQGKVERFVVRVNAQAPGIYDFDVRLVGSHKNLRQEVTVVRNVTFLFERVVQDDRR